MCLSAVLALQPYLCQVFVGLRYRQLCFAQAYHGRRVTERTRPFSLTLTRHTWPIAFTRITLLNEKPCLRYMRHLKRLKLWESLFL